MAILNLKAISKIGWKKLKGKSPPRKIGGKTQLNSSVFVDKEQASGKTATTLIDFAADVDIGII
ncbi:hypothetical protein [Paenibacillus sp. FSL R7-0179]|uniref:hypothetical protein n=1 Tax=Paenibacillus sp. FSL R7-0179 TaxID=2921672 RepID=UPI0030FC3BCA